MINKRNKNKKKNKIMKMRGFNFKYQQQRSQKFKGLRCSGKQKIQRIKHQEGDSEFQGRTVQYLKCLIDKIQTFQRSLIGKIQLILNKQLKEKKSKLKCLKGETVRSQHYLRKNNSWFQVI